MTLKTVRKLTLAWVVIILFLPQLLGFIWAWRIGLTVVVNDPIFRFFLSLVDGLVPGAVIGYIAAVFFGVFPAVLLESLAENRSLKRGLVLNKESWQGTGLGLMYRRGTTLCSHCWITPWRLLTSAAALLATVVIMVLVAFIRIPIVTLTLLLLLCRGAKLKSWEQVGLVLVDFTMDLDEAYYMPIKPFKPLKTVKPKPVKTEPSLLTVFVFKVWEVLTMLKRRACPTIQWEDRP